MLGDQRREKRASSRWGPGVHWPWSSWHHAEVDAGIAEGLAKVNQQGALAGLLGNEMAKLAAMRSDAAAAFGAEKDEDLAGQFWEAGLGAAGGLAAARVEGAGNFGRDQRQRKDTRGRRHA